jgi:hypothetical protein
MLSDDRLLRRACAYFLSARAIFRLRNGVPLFDLNIEDVDAALTEINALPPSAEIECGIKAVRTVGAHARGLRPRSSKAVIDYQKAALFVPKNWAEIVRLANAAIELKSVSIGQINFLADSQTAKRAA